MGPIAKIPQIKELNIGHFLIGEAIFRGLTPAVQEMRRLMDDKAQIDAILKEGAEKASAIAEPVLKDVRKIIGFLDVR